MWLWGVLVVVLAGCLTRNAFLCLVTDCCSQTDSCAGRYGQYRQVWLHEVPSELQGNPPLSHAHVGLFKETKDQASCWKCFCLGLLPQIWPPVQMKNLSLDPCNCERFSTGFLVQGLSHHFLTPPK